MCVCMCVLVAQSHSALWDPMDCSLPESSVHGILQAIILEWILMPFSKGSSWFKDWTQVSCIAGRFFTVWATSEISIANIVNGKWLNVFPSRGWTRQGSLLSLPLLNTVAGSSSQCIKARKIKFMPIRKEE